MKRLTTQILTALGFLSVLTVAGIWTAPKLMAAIKAALVQNIDEPGRNPYLEVADKFCTSNQCALDFATVPAGKRLVITNVSGKFYNSSGIGLEINLLIGGSQTSYFPASTQAPIGGLVLNTLNQPTTVYVDSGLKPQIALYSISGANFPDQRAFFTIAGYYVNLP